MKSHPWLKRDRLELKSIINIARGADIKAWEPKDKLPPKWNTRFKMLKDAIVGGELPAALATPAPTRHSSVALLDVRAFLARQQGKTKWDWLRDFRETWAKEAEVDLHTPTTRAVSLSREDRKHKTREKYKRWFDESQLIENESKLTSPIKIARIIAKREEGQLTDGTRGPTAETIRRRLDENHPGWAK